jgi:hypothetical protein
MEDQRFLTRAQLLADVPLSTRDFVTEPEPCNRFYVPTFRIPENRMSPEKAQVVRDTLNAASEIIGPLAQNRSRADSDEFQRFARDFNEQTGVELLGVFDLRQQRFFDAIPVPY